MSMRKLQSNSTNLSEEYFYSFYSWCLNPILSLRDLFGRLGEELDRYGRLQFNWQREECKINLYLFVCAVGCTIDDYLARSIMDLSRIANHFPSLRFVVAIAQKFFNMIHSLQSFFDRPVSFWRERWTPFLDQVCELMVNESEPKVDQIAGLQMTLQDLLKNKLPEGLLKRRMIIPEGFRSQDLTHQDIFTLLQHFSVSLQNPKDQLVIIGPRTFGEYFAPLGKAYLSKIGHSLVSWITIRPKRGISKRERQQLRALISRDCHVLLVDDCPNTGRTCIQMVKIVRQFGLGPERITILVPRHPAQLDWTLANEPDGLDRVNIIRLEPGEFYKESLLNPSSLESSLQEYFGDRGWEKVVIRRNSEVDDINYHLREHYRDGFQVRLKRVFDVWLSKEGQPPIVKRVFVKSVGWGWLGYHAYLSGVRLANFVPEVIGLRNGLLITEWLEDLGQKKEMIVDRDVLKRLSSYIARRSEVLRLTEDPCFESRGFRWTGWDEIVKILRSVYGPFVGRLMIPMIHKQLKKYVSPIPTMVDGQMKPDEWIKSKTGIYKVDFEQHNFGGPELDVVDPAYDLTSAIFEFRLSKEAEQELLQTFAGLSGDRGISDRILLYKLLYGIGTLKACAYWIIRKSSDQKKEEWNRRYLWARNFLTNHMNQFCADVIRGPQSVSWSKRLFFMDVDGVLDTEIFGFPHTTHSGLLALRLLQSHGFSIVLNTGRSVEHVRNYCQTYDLPGGLAEFGNVFWDAVRKRELPLIDAEAAEELVQCRERIKETPGVFVDAGYEYSIRAYRYNGLRTKGLDAAEMNDLLARLKCRKLTFILGTEDTHITQKGNGKGKGLLAAKKFLGYPDEPVVAIGDSKQDLEMLEIAEFAYAPATSSKAIRDLASKGKCRIMAQPVQRGLLAAVKDIMDHRPAGCNEFHTESIPEKYSHDLMWFLLRVAELPNLRKCMATLNRLCF